MGAEISEDQMYARLAERMEEMGKTRPKKKGPLEWLGRKKEGCRVEKNREKMGSRDINRVCGWEWELVHRWGRKRQIEAKSVARKKSECYQGNAMKRKKR
jgi:hypothetical protein